MDYVELLTSSYFKGRLSGFLLIQGRENFSQSWFQLLLLAQSDVLIPGEDRSEPDSDSDMTRHDSKTSCLHVRLDARRAPGQFAVPRIHCAICDTRDFFSPLVLSSLISPLRFLLIPYIPLLPWAFHRIPPTIIMMMPNQPSLPLPSGPSLSNPHPASVLTCHSFLHSALHPFSHRSRPRCLHTPAHSHAVHGRHALLLGVKPQGTSGQPTPVSEKFAIAGGQMRQGTVPNPVCPIFASSPRPIFGRGSFSMSSS